MIRLDKRLGRIYEMVRELNFAAVIDIGCDHGKLGAKCAEAGMSVTLTDISAKSLKKARILFERLGLAGTFVCTEGLKDIDFQDALVVIAGMGGEEIIRILSSQKPDRLVLCPHHNTVKLREFLVDAGYRIVSDSMVFERGMFYDILSAQKIKIPIETFVVKGDGKVKSILCRRDNLTCEELFFGRSNLKRDNPDFERFILREYEKFEKIFKNTKISDTKTIKYVTILEKLIKGEDYV